jgi:cation diffusion facilitator CzcD-associated flavoprotein CzcO
MTSLPPVNPEYTHPLISERSIDEPRPLKVIYIGAGVSGIDAAIQFPKFVPNLELVIYEKNADVGGTWFENFYPGCACDIPAHSYQLSFESSTEWSSFYAGAPEILKYWRRVVDKYGVRKYMNFKHKAVEARWNEETSKWHVKLQKLDTGNIIEDIGDVFMTGMGALNEWKWPDIPGLKDFKGPILHSANWDSDFSAKDKTVAVIGAGSSGIQIVPTLQKHVKHMDHYVRGRTWIAATFGNELVRERNNGEDGNFDYTAEEKEAWRKDPTSYVKYRKALEFGMQGGYAVTHRGSKEHAGAWTEFEKDMRKKLAKKPEIIEHLLPDFPPLCKRLTPGPGYLEAMTSDNVHVVNQGIDHIDATGIVAADGKHRPVDAVICATGFDTSFQGRFPIFGRGGQNLQDRYRTRPETYLSVCTDGEWPGLWDHASAYKFSS